MKRLAIGIDLGCTHIKSVLMDLDGKVIEQSTEDTREPDDQHWKSRVKDIVEQYIKKAGTPDVAIGLAAPGLADPKNTCIAFMPGRLPGLENFDWTEKCGHRIFVLNDAHAALMAEARFGVAKGMRHAIMITLGTGVGGGILINGELYQGVGQMAGHFGHATVDSNTHLQDVTNMPGSLEDAIGNLTIRERSMNKYQTTWDLVTAYEKGDSFAASIWLSSVRKLAIGLASFINILSPEVIVLGGGISKAGQSLTKPLKEFLELYEWQPGGKRTELKLAHFSDQAGAIGAAAFAISKT